MIGALPGLTGNGKASLTLESIFRKLDFSRDLFNVDMDGDLTIEQQFGPIALPGFTVKWSKRRPI